MMSKEPRRLCAATCGVPTTALPRRANGVRVEDLGVCQELGDGLSNLIQTERLAHHQIHSWQRLVRRLHGLGVTCKHADWLIRASALIAAASLSPFMTGIL